MKIFFVITLLFIFSFGIARAYSVSGTAPAAPLQIDQSGINTILAPFEAFIQSLKWQDAAPLINITAGTSSTGNAGTGSGSAPEGILHELDNWFYNVTGLRLGGLPALILGAVAWILNVAAQIVNWLIGLVRH